MNEFIFLLHVSLLLGLSLLSLKISKEMLTALIVVEMVLANVFVLKQSHLFGMDLTTCEPYIVGAILGLNLLQEYFGKSEVKKCLGLGLFACLVVAIMSVVHLVYVPNAFDSMHPSYHHIFAPLPRIFAVSLFVFMLLQYFDIYFFGLLNKKFPTLNFTARWAISVLVIQFLDTLFFSLLGLTGLVHNLLHIIIMSYGLKVFVTLCALPATLFIQKMIPKEVVK
jgi:hypothetical protein